MKRGFKVLALIVSLAAAFVCLTINVGRSDVGGPSGTLVVPQGTSEEDIQKTSKTLRLAGIVWAAVALGCVVWNGRHWLPRPINENTSPVAIAHNNRGWTNYRAGRLDVAIADYKQAVAIESNYPEAWNNLGLAYGAKGETDHAIDCLTRAVTLAPQLASAHNDLALAYHSGGQRELARRHALEAQRLGHRVHPEFMRMIGLGNG